MPPDLPQPAEQSPWKGYDLLVEALLTLMSVGTDYSHHKKGVAERVLIATSSHQCFSLAMSMLGALPPSYHVLTAMVEGEGLSVNVSGWEKVSDF